MDLDRRDTLDTGLVTLALLLAVSSFVDGSGTGSLVGNVGSAVTSTGPVAFLVVFAAIVGAALYCLAFPDHLTAIRVDAAQFDHVGGTPTRQAGSDRPTFVGAGRLTER
jgi:hypothetical protein